ncbi:MAG: SUMF1/EgtB/PvdO family nonheme iron enzyme [Anaerolineales bacterium]|nr:SUMF1/EgtB/PvdO family nonheme iron enzyme [Anaerolineales bacterium]
MGMVNSGTIFSRFEYGRRDRQTTRRLEEGHTVAIRGNCRCCGDMPEHHRVVRGGAFNNNERNVRCAVRNRNNPENRNNNQGFRVVVSTLFLYCQNVRALSGVRG